MNLIYFICYLTISNFIYFKVDSISYAIINNNNIRYINSNINQIIYIKYFYFIEDWDNNIYIYNKDNGKLAIDISFEKIIKKDKIIIWKKDEKIYLVNNDIKMDFSVNNHILYKHYNSDNFEINIFYKFYIINNNQIYNENLKLLFEYYMIKISYDNNYLIVYEKEPNLVYILDKNLNKYELKHLEFSDIVSFNYSTKSKIITGIFKNNENNYVYKSIYLNNFNKIVDKIEEHLISNYYVTFQFENYIIIDKYLYNSSIKNNKLTKKITQIINIDEHIIIRNDVSDNLLVVNYIFNNNFEFISYKNKKFSKVKVIDFKEITLNKYDNNNDNKKVSNIVFYNKDLKFYIINEKLEIINTYINYKKGDKINLDIIDNYFFIKINKKIYYSEMINKLNSFKKLKRGFYFNEVINKKILEKYEISKEYKSLIIILCVIVLIVIFWIIFFKWKKKYLSENE